MRKPKSLRDHLIKRIPEFKRSPEKLALYVEKSQIRANGAKHHNVDQPKPVSSFAFEYVYTFSIAVLDFAGEPEHVIIPIIEWLQLEQPDLTDNPEFQQNGLQFEAEILDTGKVDMMLELDGITERIIVSAGKKPASEAVAERFAITNGTEPQHIDLDPPLVPYG